MKKIDPDDPRLTAYALGELDGGERADIEAALEAQPECRALVDEIRQTVARLSNALANEPCPAVEEGTRETIEAAVEKKSNQSAVTVEVSQTRASGSEKIIPFPRRKIFAIAAGIAASIVAITIWQAGFDPEKQKNRSQSKAGNVGGGMLLCCFPHKLFMRLSTPPTSAKVLQPTLFSERYRDSLNQPPTRFWPRR